MVVASGAAEPADMQGSAGEVSGVYIQQAAAMVGASTSTLRMWEKRELVSPRRTPSGYRVYTLRDIERMRRVQQLLEDGVNLVGVKRLLDQPSDQVHRHQGESRPVGNVGHNVHAFRLRRKLTLRELATATGMSPSYISAVERSIASPSIASLQKLAKAFDTNVLTLLGEGYQAQASPVTRAGQRTVLESNKGVTIEDLSTAGSNLEPLIMTVQPGGGSDGPLSHAGEEFLYIMSGEMRLRLDGVDDYNLKTGDAMAYDSIRPHHFSNLGDVPAVVVWVNTPRTF